MISNRLNRGADMRRVVFLGVGGLELAIAAVLAYTGQQLPAPAEVEQGFDRMDGVTEQASRQVGLMRRQVVDVRRPGLQRDAAKLKENTKTVTGILKAQQVDFATVANLKDSLAQVAAGLDGLSDTLDADKVGQLGVGLGETADFLDKSVVPAAERSAESLDRATADLARDAARLSAMLKEAPPDLKAAKEVYDGLGRFDEGLERMARLLDPKRLDAIRDGFSGLETSLSLTAGQAEQLSKYTYPQIRVKGLRIETEEKPFWPQGDEVAAGLRKSVEGVRAAQKELGDVGEHLPALRQSLEESRKSLAQTRASLGQALKQRDKLEPLLRDVPLQSARLAEDLPKLGQELAQVMRDTKKMRDVAVALRKAQQGIEATTQKWPAMKTGLLKTATVVRAAANQLDRVLQRRQEYEAALAQTTELADTFAATVPVFTDEVVVRLDEQEKALADMERSLDDARSVIPAYKRSARDVVSAGRLLAWLVAALIGLHGTFLLAENWRRPTRGMGPPA